MNKQTVWIMEWNKIKYHVVNFLMPILVIE
jgi:hypothetical protein